MAGTPGGRVARDYAGKLQTVDAPGPSQCFVLIPNTRPHAYLLTHRCVAFVACLQCGAIKKEPCKGKTLRWPSGDPTYGAQTHYVRRKAYKALLDKV